MHIDIIRPTRFVVGERRRCGCGNDNVFYLREDCIRTPDGTLWKPLCWIEANMEHINVEGEAAKPEKAKTSSPPSLNVRDISEHLKPEPSPPQKPAKRTKAKTPPASSSPKETKTKQKSRKQKNIELIMGDAS